MGTIRFQWYPSKNYQLLWPDRLFITARIVMSKLENLTMIDFR